MVRAIIPAAPSNLSWLQTGRSDQPASVHGRLPALEEEDDEEEAAGRCGGDDDERDVDGGEAVVGGEGSRAAGQGGIGGN